MVDLTLEDVAAMLSVRPDPDEPLDSLHLVQLEILLDERDLAIHPDAYSGVKTLRDAFHFLDSTRRSTAG